MEYYKSSLALREQLFGPKSPHTVQARDGVAQCELELGHLENASNILNRCLKDVDATSSHGRRIVASILLTQSRLEQSSNKPQEALATINRAIGLCEYGWEIKPQLLKVKRSILARKNPG